MEESVLIKTVHDHPLVNLAAQLLIGLVLHEVELEGVEFLQMVFREGFEVHGVSELEGSLVPCFIINGGLHDQLIFLLFIKY